MRLPTAIRLRTRRLPALAVAGLAAVVLASCGTGSAPGAPAGGRSIHGTPAPITGASSVVALTFTSRQDGRAPSSLVGGSSTSPRRPVGPSSATLIAAGPPRAGFTIRIPVFMYHRVAPDAEIGNSLRGLVVSPTRFAAQMDALERAGWTTITAAQLADDLAAGQTPPAKSFVLTFDDGHQDGYTYALPILRSHNFVATFYVITGRIDRPGYFTTEQLQAMTAAGMEIASHTVSHLDVTRLSLRAVTTQLRASAQAIRSAVGIQPTTFAYPFGKWDRALAGPLAATGYGLAFIEGGTCARATWPSRFAIARLRVERATTPAAVLAAAAGCG